MKVLEILLEVGNRRPCRTTIKLSYVSKFQGILVQVDSRPEGGEFEDVYKVRDFSDAFDVAKKVQDTIPAETFSAAALASLILQVAQPTT